MSPLATSFTLTYIIVGLTQSARLEGSVQGVVVHARKDSAGLC